MEAVLTSLIAVAGTVTGAMLTYVFQRQSMRRSERFNRSERLRQERIAAYSKFAEAIMTFRVAQYDRWALRSKGQNSDQYAMARAESRRLRAAAWHALYGVRLLAAEPRIASKATNVMEIAVTIDEAEDIDDLKDRGERTRKFVEEFIELAASQAREYSDLAS